MVERRKQEKEKPLTKKELEKFKKLPHRLRDEVGGADP
jgi:hypothetical protein